MLRTGLLPSAESVRETGAEFETLDALYEKSRTYETFTQNALKEIRRAAKGAELCYCVDGGVSEDRIANALIAGGGEIEIIEGATKSAKAAAAAGLAVCYQAVSAYEISEAKLTLPLVVYDIASRELAGDVKLKLAQKFGDDAPACFLCGSTVKKIPIFEADRQNTYHEGTSLVVYDRPLLERKRVDAEDLMEILRRLRAPDGCPWDKVQTHQSIRINAIEEAYELVDAVDCDDPDKLCEEAGDVIMQAAFHTLIEEERGNFDLTDVLSGVCEKLITRHTHVFGKDKDKAANADGALSVWDRNKMTEKHQATYSDAVNDVPKCFPALLRAQKIAKRVRKGGWDFPRADEESEAIERFENARARGDKTAAASAFGEMLMNLAFTAYSAGIDAEQALLDAVKRVASIYNEWEKSVIADGKDVDTLTRDEREYYYRKAKTDAGKN